jgi:hypothetical protein
VYSVRSIAPKHLSFHQYSHRPPQQQQQSQQASHMEHDHEIADDAPPYFHSRSHSRCRDSRDPRYIRKIRGVDATEEAFAGYHDFEDFSESPETSYHAASPDCASAPNIYDYPVCSSSSSPPPSSCADAALATLRLCYYPTLPSAPQSRKHESSKKSKCTGLGRLPVVVSSDDKPHVCGIGACNARFKRQEHLRRHERTHTDERPFSCEVCGRKFSRTDNLRMHRKTHMKKTGRNVYVAGLE